MKSKKICQICKKKTNRLICFEDDQIDEVLVVCSYCYGELCERGLPKNKAKVVSLETISLWASSSPDTRKLPEQVLVRHSG